MTTPNYPTVWYWVVQDTNPTTQVWEASSGAFVANTSANYLSWVANGGRSFQFTPQHPISAAVDNGAGLIRVTTDNTPDFTTGDAWVIQNVVMTGATVINGEWLVTVINGTQLDLQGSTFVGGDSVATAGVIDRGSIMPTAAAMYAEIDRFNQAQTPPSYLAVSSGVNYQLANTPPLLFDFTPTQISLSVTLSQMNLFGSVAKGRPLIIHNAGSFPFSLKNNSGSSFALFPTVPIGMFVHLYLNDNSTGNGSFDVEQVVRTVAVAPGDANASLSIVGNPITTVVTTALTAPRTWTLSTANSGINGMLILVADTAGVVTSTNTITIPTNGIDLLNGNAAGSVVLNRAFDWVLLETNGNTRWTIVGGNGSLNFSDISGTVAASQLSAATTQASGDNSTLIATDAFVTTAINNAIAGVNPAVAVVAATTTVLPTTPTYNNGVSGVGATLTAGANAVLTIDGYTPLLNARVLIKNQASAFQNGVYNVTQLGVAGVLPWILTRALDYDQPSDINSTGAIPVINGTANATTSWVITSTVNTVGTDALTYTQFTLAPASVLQVANNLSDVASAATSRTNLGLGTMATVNSPAPVANGGTGDTGTAWTPFTPTVAAGTGTFTTVSAAGRYKTLGKTVWYTVTVTITTNGTAGSYITLTMPGGLTAHAATYVGAGRNINNNVVDVAIGSTDSNHIYILSATGTYPGADGMVLDASGTYEAA